MATQMIAAADIPDARLVHNGGDITCGEAVRQAGGKLQFFNVDKEYVWCPSAQDGGHEERPCLFPGARRNRGDRERLFLRTRPRQPLTMQSPALRRPQIASPGSQSATVRRKATRLNGLAT